MKSLSVFRQHYVELKINNNSMHGFVKYRIALIVYYNRVM